MLRNRDIARETICITIKEYLSLLDAKKKVLLLEKYGIIGTEEYSPAMEEYYGDLEGGDNDSK